MLQQDKRGVEFEQFKRVLRRTVTSIVQRDRKLGLNTKTFLAAISEIFIIHLREEVQNTNTVVANSSPSSARVASNPLEVTERRDQSFWGRGKRELFVHAAQEIKAHFIYLTDADLKAVMRHLYRQWSRARKP